MADVICDRPPTGWHCTRKSGHEGPCAAVPTRSICPHCPAGHREPGSKSMAVTVGPELDKDGQETTLHVRYADGHHVCGHEVRWLCGLVATDSVWKAKRLFSGGIDALDGSIEALVISKQESDPPTATPLYRIDANLGWADEIIATDLREHIALGIAYALDVVYGCGVYDEQGRML